MSDVFENAFFAKNVDENASAMLCDALTDKNQISQVTGPEPVTANNYKEDDYAAVVRPSTPKSWRDGMPSDSSPVLKKAKMRLCAAFI